MKILSDKLPFILTAMTVVVMAVSTCIESFMGFRFIADAVYDTWWFTLLWVLLAVASICLIVRRRLWRQTVVFMLHISFIVILSGALLTRLTSSKGSIHLRLNSAVNSYKTDDSENLYEQTYKSLPFAVILRNFRVECYQGTEAPQDYVSRFDILDVQTGRTISHAQVSMNRIFSYEGYRFYQSSYDADERGSWLTINYDPYGTVITYMGYALMAFSMLLFLVLRAGRFHQYIHKVDWTRLRLIALIIFPLFWIGETRAASANKNEHQVTVVERTQADAFRNRQVLYNDRVVPVNTMALDFVKKITGSRSFRHLTPEQVMLSWMLYPQEWQYVPMIRLKKNLCEKLGISGRYARFIDFFDSDGHYRLEKWMNDRNDQHDAFMREIEAADEKVGIILMLTKGTLGKSVAPECRLPESKIRAEIFYNTFPVHDNLFILNLTLGILSFALSVIVLMGDECKSWLRRLAHSFLLWCALRMMLTLLGLMLLASFSLRWYITGTIPLSNAYETMQFMALVTVAVSALLGGKMRMAVPLGYILSGIVLLVAHISGLNPQITPLMPVLHSPWLSSHVSFVMLSYTLYAFMLMLSATAWALSVRPGCREQCEALTNVSRILLYPATFTLSIGIFLGAVWANVSWGSYWSWDPKEVWALITLLVYAAAFHTHSLPWLATCRGYNVYVVFSFLAILMTYFGVNYLLGGMHSYAG